MLYQHLSQFPHPRYLGLAVGRDERAHSTYLYLGGEFRRSDALYAYNALLGMGMLVAEMMGGFVAHALPDWQVRLQQLNQDWIAWKAIYDADLTSGV